jgi:p58 integrase-like protein
VLLRKENHQKFQPKFLGPFRIVKKCPLNTYQLVDPLGRIKQDLVHGDRLKPFAMTADMNPRELWARFNTTRRHQLA